MMRRVDHAALFVLIHLASVGVNGAARTRIIAADFNSRPGGFWLGRR